MIVMDYLEQDLMHWIKNDLGTKVINFEELRMLWVWIKLIQVIIERG